VFNLLTELSDIIVWSDAVKSHVDTVIFHEWTYNVHNLKTFWTGAEVVNATDLVKEPPKFQRWVPPVEGTQFSPPKTIKDDPDYHEDPVYEFHPECRLLEGTTIYFIGYLHEIC